MSDQQKQDSNLQPPYYFEEDTISLMDIMLTLVRQLKIILIPPIIFCILAIINVQFIAKSVYTSTAKIMPSSGGGGISQAAGLAAQFGINIPTGLSETTWVYPEIVKSRTIARAMLKRKFDTQEFGFQKSLLQILTNGEKDSTIDHDIFIKAGVDQVIDMVDIELNGSFYDLTISAAEPLFAKDLTVALIEELDIHQQEYNKAKASETRQFIEERIIETKKELEAAEETLRDFTTRNRRIENSPLLMLDRQRLSREVSVLIGVFTTLKQQLETTKIEEVKESDYVIVLDPPEANLRPIKPNKRRTIILAGVFGIGLGIFIGFVRDYFQNGNKEELEKMAKAKSILIKNIMNFMPKKLLKR